MMRIMVGGESGQIPGIRTGLAVSKVGPRGRASSQRGGRDAKL